ncbi:unnamed protein product [Ectocarpus sp. 12 AP-2014]
MPQHEDSIARKPLQRFKRLTGSLETLISSIAQDWEDLATAPAADAVGLLDDDGPTVHGKMRKAQLLFTELHSTTRKLHSAIETIRNKVASAKQTMDVNHLQLENLLYERDYLSRETQLCRDFTMTELNKMEEEEEQGFLEDVDTLQTAEEHADNLAILKDQKEQRINAQLALKATQIRVKAANSTVKESRDYLDRLPENLKDVERALAPLKKNMPWRPGSRRGRHERSSELPGPLFTLYCQLEAYCDSVLAATGGMDESGAFSSLATFGGDGGDVGGDRHPPGLAASVTIEPAKACVSASAKAAAAGPKDASDSAEAPAASTDSTSGSSEPGRKRQRLDSEQEDGGSGVAGGGEGGARLKRTISRREAGKATLEALRPSPLEVQLTINFGDRKNDAGAAASPKASGSTSTADTFKVRFSFLPSLGVVAVRPAAHDGGVPLANLFPADTGKDTPNPANHHNKAAQASPLGVFEYPADIPCRPYRWAQRLAGLRFPPAADGGGPVAASTMPIEPTTRSAVAALRSRARTLAALGGQLKALSDGKGPSPLPGSRDEVVTEGVELRSWKELSGSELQQASTTFQENHASKSGSSEEAEASSCSGLELWERFGARYFKGTLSIKQGREKERIVHVQVEVPAEYPLRPSLISLTEDSKPDADGAGDAALREELCTVANEVNAHYDTLLTEDVDRWDHLLSHQLLLVMECLASKAGTLGRLRKGRMRRKPAVFEHLEGKFVDRGSLLTARTDTDMITLTPMEM